MTWTTPSVPAAGGHALLPHGPLTLGDIVGGAWRVYKARFGLFLKLLLMPFMIMFGATLVFGLVIAAMVLADPRGGQQATPAVIGLGILFYIAMLAISLLVYVYQGRTVIGGIDLATGRANPTSANLAERTRGMLGRVFILMLIAFAASIVLVVALIAAMVPIGMAADSDSSSANGASILLGFVFLTAVYVGAIWFMIKVVYTIPAMAEEGLDAIPSIKRSFQLTKGAFWKTFGYQLVLGLIGMALFLVPYFVMMGAAFALAQSQGQNSAAALTGMGFALLVLYAVLLLYVPYQYLFTGLMYLSRSREQAGVTAPSQYGGSYGVNPWDAPPAPPAPGDSAPRG